MKKLTAIVVTLCGLIGVVAYGSTMTAQQSQRDLGDFTVGGYSSISVSRFVDPDNGNICYLMITYGKGGISCVNP